MILIISACSFSSPQGYYTQMQLSTNIYRIELIGTRATAHQRVRDFALLRAAEITIEKGKKRFVIIADNIKQESEIFTYSPTQIGTREIGGIVEPIYSAPQMETVKHTQGTMTIELIEKKDKRYKSAYDAKIISSQLTPILRSNDENVNWLRK